MQDWVHFLPHVNATLNSLATILLLASFFAVKGGRLVLHRNLMIAAFVVSAVFLCCYLTYHFEVKSKKFPVDDYPISYAYGYWVLLASHVLLAITVPFLVIWSMVLGFRDQREKHKRLVKWAFPIWVYVSLTGVTVYLLLYWVFLPKSGIAG